MKKKWAFPVSMMLLCLSTTVKAQQPVYPKPNNKIVFGKKLPPPAVNTNSQIVAAMYDKKKKVLPFTTFDTVSKQFIVHTADQYSPQYLASTYTKRNNQNPSAKPINNPGGFHLTKDINTSTEASYPSNYSINGPLSFAVMDNISYFSADDGIHGRELWRSDGSSVGTYMVRDINTSDTGSNVNGIIAANGVLFFSAETSINGNEPWVSDGTESGTHLLKDLNEFGGSYPNQFTKVNNLVYFVTSTFGYNSQLWKTDGTENGTMLVTDLQQNGIGQSIFELTAVNDMVYFIAYTYNAGYQLFRSDGTDAGTFIPKQIGFFQYDYAAPMQLTAYNNQLFFSADDGTGRRLWTSNGTFEETNYAAGFNDVFMQQDYLSIYNNSPFIILNNILFISGFTFNDGSGLYKYDASNADGIVLVKDLTPTTDVDFIVAPDMRLMSNSISFKVISSINGYHDELWSTNGQPDQTQLIRSFGPGDSSVYTYNFLNANNTLYFVVNNSPGVGTELWKSDGTAIGTTLVKDIFVGPGGSYPENLTFCSGKVFFRATEVNTGTELWETDGTVTALVKDINNAVTGNSEAGFFYRGITPTTNGVLFNAYTPALGGELYKSDGTSNGTVLVEDIAAGVDWSFPNNYLTKNNVIYFIGDDATGTAIYKTNGTNAGTQRAIPYINRDNYYVVNYNVADNGIIFYTLGNRPVNGGPLELWRSDGTEAGTYMLTSSLSYYFSNYVEIIGNTVFFIGGDFDHGYELWKSNGTVAGTAMIKDINPGYNSSAPYSLFVFKGSVYFGAWDGGIANSLWKSDGTAKGTVKVKSIVPALYQSFLNPVSQHIFCISNNTLFFVATDLSQYGTELWKTNGTENGTRLVKDINLQSSYPDNLTDVNGTLYFTADDGEHGTELWKTTGNEQSTLMVKDISPFYGGYLNNFCSAGGRLFFINFSVYPASLWVSNGTANGTNAVNDPGLTGLSNFGQLTASGNKLFFGAYSRQYGDELYEGDASGATVNVQMVSKPAITSNSSNHLEIYPNPSKDLLNVVFKQEEQNNVNLTLTDISGRLIMNKTVNAVKGKNVVPVPVKALPAGCYFIKINGNKDQVIQFVKQD